MKTIIILSLLSTKSNKTNYFQKDTIIAATQPFNDYFDASLVWGPVSGRLLYAGFRYKLK